MMIKVPPTFVQYVLHIIVQNYDEMYLCTRIPFSKTNNIEIGTIGIQTTTEYICCLEFYKSKCVLRSIHDLFNKHGFQLNG